METRFPSEVSALESTFEKIQNDYILSVGSENSKEDYTNKLKVVFIIPKVSKRITHSYFF